MDRVTELQIFLRVAELGSFTAAGRRSGVSQSTVSKAVRSIEDRLGVRLLNRTTRRLSLTDEGRSFAGRIREVLSTLQEAESEARSAHEQLQGRLRINTSTMLAVGMVQPVLLDLGRKHPELELELDVDDRRIDPVERSADVTIRVGKLSDSTMTLRRAGTLALRFFAAPQYLERIGASTPQALWRTTVDLIEISQSQLDPNAGTFTFALDETDGQKLRWRRAIRVSTGLLARDAALSGAGIAVLPELLVHADVSAGRLVPVLKTVPLPGLEVSMLTAFGGTPPRRVSAFMDYAIAQWRRNWPGFE